MSEIAIQVENLSKRYRLGSSGTGTIVSDVNRFVARIRGKEDPTKKIGFVNDRTKKTNEEFVWSLQDINFKIQQGDAVGIIGKNGAGKSTLLKIISRITSPTTGQVKMRGRVASLLEVGTGFHPELTGRENIFMNGSIMGMTRQEIKSKFDEIVDFSGCERYIDTPVKRYSSGMHVRLAFAVSAHLEPEILIVDEVLAVGDAEFQKKCLNKMDQVSRNDGRTVLFVSHNMTAIKTLCKKGILLKNGMLIGDGSIDDVVNLYAENEIDSLQTSISDLNNRQGNGLLRFVDIKFYDLKGKPTSHFFVGEGVEIHVSYEADDAFFMSTKTTIDIDINDSLNNRVAWLSSSIYKKNIDADKKVIVFQVEKIRLAQGDYNFNLYAANDLGIADWIMNVSRINILYNDYYGTGGKVPEKQLAMVTDFSLR
ncbi:ABC transporter ATP-binding protein [Cytophaga aurantiaca]|uniref:ABC transporter ATP-binding protein n=1 Tax=Cytophaga aurantiaca TaxID=29530 RepID=UPI00036C6158|nr:ABC transporter ATP-binding protein [Cytophaga aurantiaca]